MVCPLATVRILLFSGYYSTVYMDGGEIMDKFTKGPWNCNRASSAGYDIVCAENSPVDVAVISRRGKSQQEIEANAKLIAAVPELLQTLRNLCVAIEQEQEYGPLVSDAIKDAKKAIDKATK